MKKRCKLTCTDCIHVACRLAQLNESLYRGVDVTRIRQTVSGGCVTRIRQTVSGGHARAGTYIDRWGG